MTAQTMITQSNPRKRTFLIAYEFADDRRAEAALELAISRSVEKWARPLQGVWYVETDDELVTLRDRFAAVVSEDDGLIVQEVSGRIGLHGACFRWTSVTGREPRSDNQRPLCDVVSFGQDRISSRNTSLMVSLPL